MSHPKKYKHYKEHLRTRENFTFANHLAWRQQRRREIWTLHRTVHAISYRPGEFFARLNDEKLPANWYIIPAGDTISTIHRR